ncbi:ejaculatory bulb-specific protein 3 [Bemisia tabaci]
MNKIVLALFALCALFGFSSAAAATKESTKESTYTNKYDNIDLGKILTNDRLFLNYFKCLMDEHTCSPDGAELKKVLPDALSNKCAKCTERQRSGSEKVIRHLIDNKPEMWAKLEAKYDPKGTYRKTYKNEAEKLGIKV